MINQQIKKLIVYGLESGLIEKDDEIFITNRYLELFELEAYEEPHLQEEQIDLEEVLKGMTDYACQNGIIKENTQTCRDLFDTKIMGILVPNPSTIIRQFHEKYKASPKEATDFYYRLSQDTDYIRRYRIKKDMKWKTRTPYGDIDITINLSKPEKDPREIASARLKKQSGYPKCLLCKEYVGFAGNVSQPARQNHRIIPITINGQNWGFQYSPYVYYNEHCIAFNYDHTPMKIDQSAFIKLFDFIKLFPHYFIGSNADLPIVGGSILSHDHFQGGNYEFPMAKAPMERYFVVDHYEDVEAGVVTWPMSVIRLRCEQEQRLVFLADEILRQWREYSDTSVGIYAKTNGEPHNTITPIARKVGCKFELDLVLRNNLTTEEYPLGVFHPHEELHHIKKENIGLIEVMGLAVLPSRLKADMDRLSEYILEGRSVREDLQLAIHADWVEAFLPKYGEITSDQVQKILQDEIGSVFLQVLEHAGVFKRTPQGQEAFDQFIEVIRHK